MLDPANQSVYKQLISAPETGVGAKNASDKMEIQPEKSTARTDLQKRNIYHFFYTMYLNLQEDGYFQESKNLQFYFQFIRGLNFKIL
jgi:hypothetical protein